MSANIFDERNVLVLQITDNEMVFRADEWDVEFVGNTLTVRHGLRDIFSEMVFELPGKLSIRRGRILLNGIELLVAEDYVSSCKQPLPSGRERRSAVHGQVSLSVGNTPRPDGTLRYRGCTASRRGPVRRAGAPPCAARVTARRAGGPVSPLALGDRGSCSRSFEP